MKMLINIIFGLLLLFGAIGLGLLIQKDSGYVLFAYGQWTVEMSLWLAVIGFVFAVVILIFLLKIIFSIAGLHHYLAYLFKRWQRRKAGYLAEQGMVYLCRGDWIDAEKAFFASAERSRAPIVNLLLAAQAAQIQERYVERDDYLASAQALGKDESLAALLAKAHWQIKAQQWQDAGVTLQQLKELAPKQKQLLYLFYEYYYHQAQWSKLALLLNDLFNYRVLTQEKALQLSEEVYRHLLEEAGSKEQLVEVWDKLPYRLHVKQALIKVYIKKLLDYKAYGEAEQLIRSVLEDDWDDELVYWYGNVVTERVDKQIVVAEQWLKKHPQDPELLFCLARLCIANQLWGKARNYLETCLDKLNRPEVYWVYVQLLEQLGELQLAAKYARKGLAINNA